jgi:hypothetical protein
VDDLESPLPADAPAAGVAPVEVVPVEEPVKAATWQDRPAKGPWCPDAVRPFVAELGVVSGADTVHRTDVAAAGWRVVGASRRGRMHAHRAEHREDAMAQAAWRDGWVLAVADGAGSAALSRIGAELAVRTIISDVLEHVVAGTVHDAAAVMDHAMQAAIVRVRRAAVESGTDPRQLRCTLLAACAIRVDGTERLVIAQVGDGVIAVMHRDGRITRIGLGDSGEFSGEVACFVPDSCADARATASVTVVDAAEVELLLVASDGVEDPFYPIERTGPLLIGQLLHGVQDTFPGFQRQTTQPAVLRAVDAGEALLEWLRYEKRGENDDRTFVVAHRVPLSSLTR